MWGYIIDNWGFVKENHNVFQGKEEENFRRPPHSTIPFFYFIMTSYLPTLNTNETTPRIITFWNYPSTSFGTTRSYDLQHVTCETLIAWCTKVRSYPLYSATINFVVWLLSLFSPALSFRAFFISALRAFPLFLYWFSLLSTTLHSTLLDIRLPFYALCFVLFCAIWCQLRPILHLISFIQRGDILIL